MSGDFRVPTPCFMVKNIWNRIFRDIRISKDDPDSVALKKQNLMAEQSLGKNGFDYIDDTATHGSATDSYSMYCAIYATAATVINSIEGEGISETGVALPEKGIIVGHIETIQLTSGSVIAYKAVS